MSRGPKRSTPVFPLAHPKIDRNAEREKFMADRERQRRALAMWARKVTYSEIARQMGCSAYTAHRIVRRALANLDVPEAVERKRQENEALDELERIFWSVL